MSFPQTCVNPAVKQRKGQQKVPSLLQSSCPPTSLSASTFKTKLYRVRQMLCWWPDRNNSVRQEASDDEARFFAYMVPYNSSMRFLGSIKVSPFPQFSRPFFSPFCVKGLDSESGVILFRLCARSFGSNKCRNDVWVKGTCQHGGSYWHSFFQDQCKFRPLPCLSAECSLKSDLRFQYTIKYYACLFTESYDLWACMPCLLLPWPTRESWLGTARTTFILFSHPHT